MEKFVEKEFYLIESMMVLFKLIAGFTFSTEKLVVHKRGGSTSTTDTQCPHEEAD